MRSVALLHRPAAALLTCGVAITTVLALATGGAASAADRAGPADVAPGAPGAPSYFDLARKDCVGTAAGTRSKGHASNPGCRTWAPRTAGGGAGRPRRRSLCSEERSGHLARA